MGCGRDKETINYVVMECQKVQPARIGGMVLLPEALEFAVVSSINWSVVDITKQ